jgi:hypothetical protein
VAEAARSGDGDSDVARAVAVALAEVMPESGQRGWSRMP